MTDHPQNKIEQALHDQFGIKNVTLHYGLSQDELFFAAIKNDRGRVTPEGSSDEQKAYQTALGVDGPLVYYSDPSCTGRPVDDTFAVARSEVKDTVWWKKGFTEFDPEAFDRLLPRVVEYLNEKQTQKFYPLALNLCKSCNFVQLSHVVPPEIIYKYPNLA